jgi:hypothetical protein
MILIFKLITMIEIEYYSNIYWIVLVLMLEVDI